MPTTTFVWDPVNDCVISELDGTGATQAVYTNEPQQYGGVLSQRRGSTSSFLHADALGTTRLLTSTAGATTDTYLFDAWGNPVSSTGSTVNPFRWVGRYGYYTDLATGLVYVRARVYTPSLQQWCSRDPAGFVDGMNLYRYTQGQPALLIDPSGTESRADYWKYCDCCEDLIQSFRAEFGKTIKGRRTDNTCNLLLSCMHGCEDNYPAHTARANQRVVICFDCRMGGDVNHWRAVFAHELEHARDFCDKLNLSCLDLHISACEAQADYYIFPDLQRRSDWIECCKWFSCKGEMAMPIVSPPCNSFDPPAKKCWKWNPKAQRYEFDKNHPDCQLSRPKKRRPLIEM
ncbi:MAG: RHS repeat-associated core domain-containing protein [Planctomyces sp.]|nr:RHS repeat-associated core domain-containing protein [Planctomyces sp.]